MACWMGAVTQHTLVIVKCWQASERGEPRKSQARDRKLDSLRLAIRDLENKLALALQHNADM